MVGKLIPRRKLFGNPTYLNPSVSPDGRWLSWSAPSNNVLNIWLAPLENIQAAQPITRTKGRPIWRHDWMGDSGTILFLNDENGNEDNHVFSVDVTTRDLRDLTPINDISARIKTGSRRNHSKIAIGLNHRDKSWHDLYLVDVATGRSEQIFEAGPNSGEVYLDQNFIPRISLREDRGGGKTLLRLHGEKSEEMFSVDYEDAPNLWVIDFLGDNKHFLMTSSVNHQTTGIVLVNCEDENQAELSRHPIFDYESFVLDPVSNELLAGMVRGARQKWFFITPSMKEDFRIIMNALKGFEFEIISMSDDKKIIVIAADKPEQGLTYFLYDRANENVKELFRARPEMKQYKLSPAYSLKNKSRDGLDLYSYLTLPRDVKGKKPVRRLPLVLDVHGGPWSRDVYGYNRRSQWLADRGYAVLNVNYRASTGFGKSFMAAGEKEHGRKMHNDLIDMVNWAIDQKIADPKKIAITGVSYGGYASFVGATFTPEVFCCSIPVVGITNLKTLLDSIPPYWEASRQFFYRSYGDPNTESGREILAERSPINRINEITSPMLIFHGLNDVRCKIAESDTIVAAMKSARIPVTYVVFPDEGHGFSKPSNDLAYQAMMEYFLAQHLGGAFEPYGSDLMDSSHEIREGAMALGLGPKSSLFA